MKYIITENKIDNLLRNIFTENGLEKTLYITGLNIFQLFDKMEPVTITTDMSHDLLYHIFSNYKKELTKKIGHYKLEFNFDGVLEWIYENKDTKEYMYSLCTPYWDGDSRTPIDCEYYTNNNFQIDKESDDEYFTSFKGPEEFNSLYDLMYWYENEYIPTVYNTLNDFLTKFRNKIV